MHIFENISDIQSFIATQKKHNKSIGFVPTMGALHEGHASLYKKSKSEQEITIASIFVNPTQFGPNEDFAKYPRTFEADVKLLENLGVDALFFPSVESMYPIHTPIVFNFPEISQKLCGKSRPTHFQGVLQVVMKLLSIIQPSIAYFGQKDFQQTVLIQTMAKEFFLPYVITVCPTLREPDGLAMSSRNRYLNSEERAQAPILYQVLQKVKKEISEGNPFQEVLAQGRKKIEAEPLFRLDYLDMYQVDELKNIEQDTLDTPCVIAIAAWLGNTRLIDNLLIP